MKKLILLIPVIAACALVLSSCATGKETATTTTNAESAVTRAPISTSPTVTRQSSGGY